MGGGGDCCGGGGGGGAAGAVGRGRVAFGDGDRLGQRLGRGGGDVALFRAAGSHGEAGEGQDRDDALELHCDWVFGCVFVVAEDRERDDEVVYGVVSAKRNRI